MSDFSNSSKLQKANARLSSGRVSKQRAAQPQRIVDWDAAIERLRATLAEIYGEAQR